MIDNTNRNTALASALVEELARSGVHHAIASPGSRSSPITLALDREPGIELRMVLDERSAGFVALGIALQSGTPAIVACTSGSAAANLHPAIVEADEAGVPMLVLTSDRPPELRGIGAGQAIDQIKLYGDAVRWFCEAGTHDANDAGLMHYRSLGCRAFTEAQQGAGPVHLNLAWRDPLGPEPNPDEVVAADPLALSGRDGGRPLTVGIRSQEPAAAVVEAISEAISCAERPLIVAGRYPGDDLAEPVAALARNAEMPLLAEPTSQLRSGPHVTDAPVIAAYDLILRAVRPALAPDLVIRFGDMPTSKPLRALLSSSGGPDQIVIDPPGRWNEPTRRAGALVRADAIELARDLAERFQPGPEPHRFLATWLDAERTAQEAIDAELGAGSALSEPLVARMLGAALEDSDQLLLASSMPIRDAESFFPAAGSGARTFSNRGANGIDGLLATSAGLATSESTETWALIGDLALLHDLGGLLPLSDQSDRTHVVVLDNGGGRIFEALPQAGQIERQRFERLFITPSVLEVSAAAQLFGLDYTEITNAEGLRAALAERPTGLIHVRIDPSTGVDLRRGIAAAVTAALVSAADQGE